MCLTAVSREFDEPKLMQFFKVMYRIRREGKCNLYKFQTMKRCKPLEKGVVRRCSVGSIELPNDGFDLCPPSYRAGFHGYTDVRWAAKQLRYSRHRTQRYRYRYQGKGYPAVVLCEGLVHTIGNQRGKRVAVAKTMKILREIPLTQLFKKKAS